MLGILIVCVLIGPYLWIPEKLSVAEAIKLKNQGPSFRFPLGTDQLGRDMLARMLLGGPRLAGRGPCRHGHRHRLRHLHRHPGGLLPPA